jgi:hypothetical protein
VVFDEAFVRAAVFYEPSAEERLLAAAAAQAEAEAAFRARLLGGDAVDGPDTGDSSDLGDAVHRAAHPAYRRAPDGYPLDLVSGAYGDAYDVEYEELYAQRGPYRGGAAHWHRMVAWLLALVMGIGVVALAFAAVYRGASGTRQAPVPPAPTAPSSGRLTSPGPARSPGASGAAGPSGSAGAAGSSGSRLTSPVVSAPRTR